MLIYVTKSPHPKTTKCKSDVLTIFFNDIILNIYYKKR